MGAGAYALSLSAWPAWAEEDQVRTAIHGFTGGAPVADGPISLEIEDYVENGHSVPISLGAENASALMLVAPANPTAQVVVFRFGPLSGASSASTRVRLADSQDLLAFAELRDGSFIRTARSVTVTVGGCNTSPVRDAS